MKKWMLMVIMFLSISLLNNVFAQANANSKMAKNIIENWFAAMKNQQYEKAASYLAPQFTSIHTDGIVRNKSQEMELIKNLDMKSYTLSDFKYVQSGNAIVVTYKDKGQENIDNNPIAAKAAGRMAVLQRQDNKWLILAYANLDQIT